MSRTLALVGAGVLVVAGLFWWNTRPAAEVLALDLVAALDDAQQSPSPEAFAVVDARLDGVTRRAILVTEPSRLTWSVEMPSRAWLRVGFGLSEDAWQLEGDGVLFQVGVSDGDDYIELFNLMVNPFRNDEDRAWHDVVVDLSDFAGQKVEVIFNTRSSAPDAPIDTRGDFALWGEPQLVVR